MSHTARCMKDKETAEQDWLEETEGYILFGDKM
jgi:hypothetical protein